MSITVTTVPQSRRPFAISLLFEELPPFERRQRTADVVSSAAKGELCLDHLVIAEQRGEALGVGLLVLQDDGVGFVWPPVIRMHIEQPRADEIAVQILKALRERLRDEQAWLGQAIVETGQRREQQQLIKAGFQHLTDLEFMVLMLSGTDFAQASTTSTTWKPCFTPAQSNDHDARIANVIEETYGGSLDCPALNEYRSGSQSIIGHRMTGTYHPEWWIVFSRETADQQYDEGVLILADHPEESAIEIAYVGVTPSARGTGLASEIMRFAIRTGVEAGRHRLKLAVDIRNEPAIRLYRRFGLRNEAVRSVYGSLDHQSDRSSLAKS